MVELYGRSWSRTALAERTGGLGQIAGVELLTLADGPERGVRVLQFRTGSGFGFRVAVDRGFDLLAADYQGIPIGWHSATGPRHPALAGPEENRGFGFLRSFTGLLATCGFDHTFGPATVDSARYAYPGFDRTEHGLHGRSSQIPARLTGYGECWDGDQMVLWAQGEVAQAMVFGEHLVLTRRIEARAGGISVTVTDEVENRGFRPTPHMLLYHYNFGFPLLAEGSEFLAPIRAISHTMHTDLRAQGVGYRTQAAPKPDFQEQVYQHDVVAGADGMASAALINPALGTSGLEGGLGVRLDYDRTALPCLVEWQCLQSGINAFGIEPSTNHVLGRPFAEERGELIELGHGETRRYRTRLSVLDGAEAIASMRAEIEALQSPPPDYAEPSGDWPDLSNRR